MVYCDNLQTIGLLIKDSPKLVTKLKHVDIQQHWLRQETSKGNIQVEWKSTSEIVADGLTKPLIVQKHNDFLKMINMVDIKGQITTDPTSNVGAPRIPITDYNNVNNSNTDEE